MDEIAIGTNKLEYLFYSKMTISSENSEDNIENKRKLAEKQKLIDKDDTSYRLYTTLGKRSISKYEIKLNINRQEKFQKIKKDIQLDINIKNTKSLSNHNLYKRNRSISLLDQIKNIFKSQNQVVPNKESNKIKIINNKIQIIKSSKSSKVNRESLINKHKVSIKLNGNENFKFFFKTEVDSQKKIKLPPINSFKNNKNKKIINEKKELCRYDNYPYTLYNKTQNSNFLIQKSFDSSIIPMKENIYSKFQLKEFLLLSKINNKPFK